MSAGAEYMGVEHTMSPSRDVTPNLLQHRSLCWSAPPHYLEWVCVCVFVWQGDVLCWTKTKWVTARYEAFYICFPTSKHCTFVEESTVAVCVYF